MRQLVCGRQRHADSAGGKPTNAAPPPCVGIRGSAASSTRTAPQKLVSMVSYGGAERKWAPQPSRGAVASCFGSLRRQLPARRSPPAGSPAPSSLHRIQQAAVLVGGAAENVLARAAPCTHSRGAGSVQSGVGSMAWRHSAAQHGRRMQTAAQLRRPPLLRRPPTGVEEQKVDGAVLVPHALDQAVHRGLVRLVQLPEVKSHCRRSGLARWRRLCGCRGRQRLVDLGAGAGCRRGQRLPGTCPAPRRACLRASSDRDRRAAACHGAPPLPAAANPKLMRYTAPSCRLEGRAHSTWGARRLQAAPSGKSVAGQGGCSWAQVPCCGV